MVRGQLVLSVADKCAQAKRVGQTPGDATLRVDSFEITKQKKAEILGRRQAGAAKHLGIERVAKPLDERIKLMLGKNLVKPLIERMSGRARQIGRRQKEWF